MPQFPHITRCSQPPREHISYTPSQRDFQRWNLEVLSLHRPPIVWSWNLSELYPQMSMEEWSTIMTSHTYNEHKHHMNMSNSTPPHSLPTPSNVCLEMLVFVHTPITWPIDTLSGGFRLSTVWLCVHVSSGLRWKLYIVTLVYRNTQTPTCLPHLGCECVFIHVYVHVGV